MKRWLGSRDKYNLASISNWSKNLTFSKKGLHYRLGIYLQRDGTTSPTNITPIQMDPVLQSVAAL